MPIEAVTSHETLAVPEGFVRRSGNHFVLRVKGNSMIEEQIRDGDFVVVNERQSVDNGEMVIALLNGNSATVKKYYRERDGRIRLQPANEQMLPIYVHEDDVTIQGSRRAERPLAALGARQLHGARAAPSSGQRGRGGLAQTLEGGHTLPGP
jgi:SOS-response transcriptional repressor LexA